jgi:putative sterol carrier protein
MAGFSVVTADGVETLYVGNYQLDESTGVLYIHEEYTDEYGEARRTIRLSPTFWQQITEGSTPNDLAPLTWFMISSSRI